jgi:hypothetical protein
VPRSELLELAKLLAQMNWRSAVCGLRSAVCGLAGGFDLPTSVMPFILRNVQLRGAFGDVPAGASSTGVAATGAGFARQPRR